MSSEHADCLNFVFKFRSFMYSNSMNNSDKFRFVGATAKQSNIYDTQLPRQPRIGESAFTIRRLFNWITWIPHAEDPDFVKTIITLLNKYNDVIFFNNSCKSGRERIQSALCNVLSSTWHSICIIQCNIKYNCHVLLSTWA